MITFSSMHHPLFFAGTAIDPITGMVMFLMIVLLLHSLIALFLAVVGRLFVQKPKRNKVSKVIFGTHMVIGIIYLWPIVMQPVFQNRFIEDNLLMLVIGYGLLSVLIAFITIIVFRTQNKQ
jgi:hypothetical protein